MISSTTDLVFVLFIATAAIFYSSRHFLRKNQVPVFLENLLARHTKKMAVVLLISIGLMALFGLISIFYALMGGDPPAQ
tara:strand:+ start:345 stop:581 length:237 start_codon:yes stop_codon:yes gene_type:complete